MHDLGVPPFGETFISNDFPPENGWMWDDWLFHLQFVDFPLVSDDDGKIVFRGVATTKENVMSMWFKDAGIEPDKPNYCGSISGQMLKNEGLRSETTDQSASTFRFPTEYV